MLESRLRFDEVRGKNVTGSHFLWTTVSLFVFSFRRSCFLGIGLRWWVCNNTYIHSRSSVEVQKSYYLLHSYFLSLNYKRCSCFHHSAWDKKIFYKSTTVSVCNASYICLVSQLLKFEPLLTTLKQKFEAMDRASVCWNRLNTIITNRLHKYQVQEGEVETLCRMQMWFRPLFRQLTAGWRTKRHWYVRLLLRWLSAVLSVLSCEYKTQANKYMYNSFPNCSPIGNKICYVTS